MKHRDGLMIVTRRDNPLPRGRWHLGVITALIVAANAVPASAEKTDLTKELGKDVVLRAMVDELERSTQKLELEDLARPYFIEYAIADVDAAFVAAELGALTSSNASPSRALRVDVRVGSYELDNTNFRSGWGGSATVPIEDDYTAIRQALWWATDRDYKQVAETFARKKAFMEQKIIEDKPDDFSREEPVVDFEERLQVEVPLAKLQRLAVDLSAVFRGYPEIQDSNVRLRGGAGNAYLVNTEGTRLRENGSVFELFVRAEVQAEDGMRLGDSVVAAAEKFDELPPIEELKKRCRGLADRLIRLKHAPKLDEAYTGPVLLDARPAATIFAGNFARRFAGGQRPVGSRSDPDDFENKIGKRILPRTVNVYDDPTQEKIGDTVVLGSYKYDDQGVPARRTSLVEEGRLQALVMSRNPSKQFERSTGHGRGMFRPTAMTGCLVVSDSDGMDDDALKQELLEAAADEDLEFGIRIASFRGGARLEAYKVYPDGREELVRGVDNVRVNLRAFKRLLALGNDPYVLNVSGRSSSQTVVAPSMLFEELDLAPMDRDFDKPPFLTSPLAQAAKDAEAKP